ncbi:MAG TPA: DUF488 domain-containing protein [Gemmatimonadaceae bacterium]|nr:DUF488 domain-containing protein [Gemmatimonadaceae bacterium]
MPRSGIATLIDVRRFPGSRRHPQFGSDALAASLRSAGINYAHFVDLGGRRDPAPDSINTSWRLDAFRGYADYMETPQFHRAVISALWLQSPLVFMCAEALWWRCHRSLISDYLTAGGIEVRHIMDGGLTIHTGTTPAVIMPGSLAYSPPQGDLF